MCFNRKRFVWDPRSLNSVRGNGGSGAGGGDLGMCMDTHRSKCVVYGAGEEKASSVPGN